LLSFLPYKDTTEFPFRQILSPQKNTHSCFFSARPHGAVGRGGSAGGRGGSAGGRGGSAGGRGGSAGVWKKSTLYKHHIINPL